MTITFAERAGPTFVNRLNEKWNIMAEEGESDFFIALTFLGLFGLLAQRKEKDKGIWYRLPRTILQKHSK